MDMEEQYDKIYRYCYFKLYDQQLAQDMTQETFLRFFRKDLSLDSGKELPYLYTIAKNLCVDEFRRKSVDSLEAMEEEISYDPSEEWAESLTLKLVIAKLPDEEQELLFLRYVNELPMASICGITGLSRFAIHRRLSKTLNWLKEEMKKEGFSE